jgi:mercuric ion binding protein
MKTKIVSLVILFVLTITSGLAQTEKKEKFPVAGNCGMCKTRIEKAAKSVEGVISADWDKVTKMIEVVYDPKKVEIDKVHLAIAKVGHDTDKAKAKDEVYNALPACCLYRDGDGKH